MKRIQAKKGEMTLGILLAVIASMIIIAFCLIQMEGCGDVKFGWFLFFVTGNIVYMGWTKVESDPMNVMVIASGPLAFFFWTIVGAWNKYIAEVSKPVKLSKKMVLDEINEGVADANKKTPEGARAYPVNNVTIKSHTDILRDLNDEITEKLKKSDVFDIDVPKIRIKQFIQIVKERNLDWAPTDFMHNKAETIVVGRRDANFGQHEEGR